MTTVKNNTRTGRGLLRRLRKRGRSRVPFVVWLPAALVVAAMLLPISYLVLRSLEGGVAGFAQILLQERTLTVLLRSIALSAAVTTASVLIAVPLAFLTARTDLPGRRAWTVLAAVPLAIPSYVGGTAIISMLGPRGALQGYLESLFGLQQLPSIYGFPGAFLALTLFTYPYVFLTTRSALGGMDPALEEASRSLGVSSWSTFTRITLPQLRPSVAAGALLVALYVLGDFGAVSLMQYDSFTRAIYVQYRAAFDRTPAAVLGLVLVALTLVILLVEARMRGRARYHRSTAGAARPTSPVRLGPWKVPALAFCASVVTFALVLPVGVLVYWLARGLAQGEPLRLVWGAALNSLYVSSLAALVTALAALPVAILVVRFPSLLSGAVERLSYLGFALPGIVVALALVFFGANYALFLYQGIALLVFAYAVNFLPQAIGATRAAILQASPRVEEAARSLGKNPLQVMATVTAPLARSGILAGMALVFLTAMNELPATLLLGPTGFDTLATRVWGATSQAFFARAAAPALILIVVSAIPMYLLTIRDRTKG